ncbi:YbfB/YjiJ family MFS transporter [Brenneria sp. 4F2]|nr:YbfB/YjiJ family MFS transporter [Brenneria bubanii]
MKQAKLILTALSGLALVGVTFGMARYGYGLYLPQFIHLYSLDKTTQGLIGSGSYAGYLIATLAASWGSGRFGPRMMLIASAVCAALGTAIVAQASSPVMLAIGVIVSGASPGIVFPALSDWVTAVANDREKNRLFTIMNSGTGAGVIVSAGLVAFTSVSVQYAWWLFSACAIVFGTLAAWLAPAKRLFHQTRSSSPTADAFRIRDWVLPSALVLYAVATVAGFVTAIYWTFSIETLNRSLPETWGIKDPALLFWMVTGFSGFLGALTGDAVNTKGLGNVLALTMVAISIALAILGLFPNIILLVLASGIIFGAAFIFITGLLGVWSMALFPNRPSMGFGLTFLLFTAGAAAGPAVSGLVASVYGQALVFNLAALVALFPCLAYRNATRVVGDDAA